MGDRQFALLLHNSSSVIMMTILQPFVFQMISLKVYDPFLAILSEESSSKELRVGIMIHFMINLKIPKMSSSSVHQFVIAFKIDKTQSQV